MCGITGLFLKKNLCESFTSSLLIDQMTNSLFHRGPDSGEIYIDTKKQIFLGHRRLSIIDLSLKACQPMTSFSNRYTIVFNGEIYNYKRIRNNLKIDNQETKSDTRILLEAISNWGLEKTLNEINGMYAFALWDRKKNDLKIVTDHLCKKPIYWVNNKNFFAFGSELKALKITPNFNKTLSRESINEYLCSGFISSPKTIYRNVFKLGNSEILTLQFNGNPIISKYSTITKKEIFSIQSSEDYYQNFTSIFSNAVEDRIVSDVPIGCFLSGGLDSSLVTYYAQQFSKKNIDTFTIGFNETKYDESLKAEKIANFLQTNHHQFIFKENDLLNLIHQSDKIFDEPFSDPSYLPMVMLSNLAKSYVKVILSGDGGDELFAGYRRHHFAYFYTVFLSKFNNKILGSISKSLWKFITNMLFIINKKNTFSENERLILTIQKFLISFSSEDISKLYSNSLSKISNPIFFDNLNFQNSDFILKQINYDENISPLKNIFKWDLNYYLINNINVKIDRSSMSKGLEIRSPFLDKRLVCLSNNLPTNKKINFFSNKILLKQLSKSLFPNDIVSNSKHPFFIPIGRWLKKDLNSFSKDLIFNGKLIDLGYFDKKTLKYIFKLHSEGKRNYQEFIWNITMFEKWFKNNN